MPNVLILHPSMAATHALFLQNSLFFTIKIGTKIGLSQLFEFFSINSIVYKLVTIW